MGQVIHLLQDMAVPAHARNDMDSHLWNNLNPGKWGNAFEKYVVTHSDAINKSTNNDKSSFTVPMRVTDFWDKNVYTGDNPTNETNQGLAEYANANFFSKYTIPFDNPSDKHKFPYPQLSSTYICSDKLPGSTKITKYVSRTACPTDGSPVDHFAAVSLRDRKGVLPTTLKKVWLDDNVHDTYARQILPRTVGYSAAMLDYFLRGKVNITVANPTDIYFRSIKVNVSNNTPGETLGVGEVKLVIRYKASTEWPQVGNKLKLNYPDKYAYKVSIPQYVDLTNPQTLTFDFSTDALPYFFADMTMQLVFKGKLGNEEEAVAVSELIPINGIYSDFSVSLPASGVYAKTIDGTLNASFNELRVKALTDIPAGLTGGNFELALKYRKAATDQFQSLPVDTEPADGVAYVIRVPEKNGASILQPGTPVELVFDLSTSLLHVSATDVYLYIIYRSATTSKDTAIGYHDISEPTPVDIFNNTNKVCINQKWYNAGSKEALDAVGTDIYGNILGDVFQHNIGNIYFKAGPSDSTSLSASQADNNLSFPGNLAPGQIQRMGFILTDYQLSYTVDELVTDRDNRDDWTLTYDNIIGSGAGFTNQYGKGQESMFTIQGQKMWGGDRRHLRQ